MAEFNVGYMLAILFYKRLESVLKKLNKKNEAVACFPCWYREYKVKVIYDKIIVFSSNCITDIIFSESFHVPNYHKTATR